MYDMSLAYKIWPVPVRFRDTLPRDWAAQGEIEYPQEWEQAKEWIANFRQHLKVGRGMVLSGAPGTGKTMLATAALNFLRGKGFSVCYVRDGDLMHLLRASYPTEEETDLIAYLQRAACTVVDDLGRTRESVAEIEPFLRYRQDEGKPTIVTMNNLVAISDTLHSFLHEFVYVTFAGEDRRINPLEPRDGKW